MFYHVFQMLSSFLCFLAKCTQEIELLTSLACTGSMYIYDLPVKESLVCGPPIYAHNVSQIKKENPGVQSAQPQTQQFEAAQSLSPAQNLNINVPLSVPPTKPDKLKFSAS